MINKILIYLNIIFLIAVFMSCRTTSQPASSNADLQKQVVELNKQLNQEREVASKGMIDEQKEADRVKKVSDQLASSLKEEIANNQIVINQYQDVLTINIAEEIFFDSGSAELKKGGYNVLDRIGKIIKSIPDKMIQIEGHTDNVSISESYKHVYANNWALGATRAINVAVYFENTLKIDPKRLSVISFSKYRPLVPNTSVANRAKNRRIEIVLVNKSIHQVKEMEYGKR